MQPDFTTAAPPERYRPQLSDSARPATFEVATINEHGAPGVAAIAGEHPLTVYVDKREILTLMTLGAAPEALVLGYLRNQRLVESLADIVAVQVDWHTAPKPQAAAAAPCLAI
jgi:FdhD protein